MGYHRAFPDAEIHGVDTVDQPRYPFTFVRRNAMEMLESLAWAQHMGRTLGYDFIHASPPCQRYSTLAKRNANADRWPDHLPLVRKQLRRIGVPWVIENVEGAPLWNPVTLCGTQFTGLRVLRHRLFETSFHVTPPPHGDHPLVFTHDKRKRHYGSLDQDVSFVQVTGGGNARVGNKAAAMGIDWMTGAELNEAIPPAYTQFVGEQFAAVPVPGRTGTAMTAVQKIARLGVE